MTSKIQRDRYESIPKRNFRNAIIRLCEENYKLLGSHKVLSMLADDIVELHKEFYPESDQRGTGWILWHKNGGLQGKDSDASPGDPRGCRSSDGWQAR